MNKDDSEVVFRDICRTSRRTSRARPCQSHVALRLVLKGIKVRIVDMVPPPVLLDNCQETT